MVFVPWVALLALALLVTGLAVFTIKATAASSAAADLLNYVGSAESGQGFPAYIKVGSGRRLFWWVGGKVHCGGLAADAAARSKSARHGTHEHSQLTAALALDGRGKSPPTLLLLLPSLPGLEVQHFRHDRRGWCLLRPAGGGCGGAPRPAAAQGGQVQHQQR